VFLLGEEAEGPAAMTRDYEFGARQEAFRRRLVDSGITTVTVNSPGELETAVLQALAALPRPEQPTGVSGVRRVWTIAARCGSSPAATTYWPRWRRRLVRVGWRWCVR